jgi:hypothetical protein
LKHGSGDPIPELFTDHIAVPHPLFKPLAWILGTARAVVQALPLHTGGEIAVRLGKAIAAAVLRATAVVPNLGRRDDKSIIPLPCPGGLRLVLGSLVNPFVRQAGMALEPASGDHFRHGRHLPFGPAAQDQALAGFGQANSPAQGSAKTYWPYRFFAKGQYAGISACARGAAKERANPS